MVKKIVSFDQLLLGMGAIWWVSISTLQHLKGNFTWQFPKSLIISKCNPSTSPVPPTFFQDPQEPHAPPNHPTIHLLSTATAFGQLLLHKRSQFLWDDEVFSYSCGSCVIHCSSSVDSSDHLQYLSGLSLTYHHTLFLHYHFLMWDLHDPAANGFLLSCFQLRLLFRPTNLAPRRRWVARMNRDIISEWNPFTNRQKQQETLFVNNFAHCYRDNFPGIRSKT